MENNEEGYCIKEHCTPHELGCNYEGEPDYKNCKHYRASGSVAAPKEEGSELIAKLKSVQPDFDKLQSYQHGFNDGVAVAIDMVETYLLTIK